MIISKDSKATIFISMIVRGIIGSIENIGEISMDLISKVIENSTRYLESMPKSVRKKIGQFFTDRQIALYMADLFQFDKRDKIRVLDPGAGTGILSAALVDKATEAGVKEIDLVIVENNQEVLDVLNENMALIANECKIKVNVTIHRENFILSQNLDFSMGIETKYGWFDYVICNPPYLKVPRFSDETIGFDSIISGAPNLYFIFMALSIHTLLEKGEAVFIIPRSWTSGAYFKKFRAYLFANACLDTVLIFESRNKVFSSDKVLQETVIVKLIKTTAKSNVRLIKSADNSFNDIDELIVPYEIVVRGSSYYVFLPTTEKQVSILSKIKKLDNTLVRMGIKLKTGVTVDFRNQANLRGKPEKGAIPLLYPANIKDGNTVFPLNEAPYQYVVANEGIKQQNKDYIFLKRFTSKEEKRRLQPALYYSESIPYKYISTDNKLNFIERIDKGIIDRETMLGLYVVLSSSIYDEYYRMLNGSTQVNATEINEMPIPNRSNLIAMGRQYRNTKNRSQELIDSLLEGVFMKEENVEDVEEKVKQAKEILNLIGMPKQQTSKVPACTLLALAGLEPSSDWSMSKNEWIRIHDMIQFLNSTYNQKYAENTRETFRKQALQHFIIAGLVENNGKPTNSPNYRYRLTEEFVALIRVFGTSQWESKLERFKVKHGSLALKYEKKRNFKKIPVRINGTEFEFSTGNHNELQKAIIEEFAPRFANGAEVLYVGDTTKKNLVLNTEALKKLNFSVDVHDKMPDVVLYDSKREWLFFVEAVTSVGEISPKRIIEIEEMTKRCNAGKIYITAFQDHKTYKKFAESIAWDTEVWISSMPDHMIHLNGDRFLGPRER
jgi:hypothetical protein